MRSVTGSVGPTTVCLSCQPRTAGLAARNTWLSGEALSFSGLRESRAETPHSLSLHLPSPLR